MKETLTLKLICLVMQQKQIDNVDKLDIDKLVLVPVDLSKLWYVVKNDVAKKNVYDK